MNPKCPPVTLNVDAVVEAVKSKILTDNPGLRPADASVHQMGVRGLGKIGLIEDTPRLDQFIFGFVTIPPVVNFATKLMQIGVILPQADMALARGIATIATLAGTIISGGKSFLLGAFLGQFPTTIDALSDMAVAAIASGRAATNPAPAVNGLVHGLGASPEDELKKLRQDLQKLGENGGEMSGSRKSVSFTY